mgnify:FL=1
MSGLKIAVSRMPKLSPREAVKQYQVSRATIMKALETGSISGEQNVQGHWRIDAAELNRMYQPRATQAAVSRSRPDQVSRSEPTYERPKDRGEPDDMAVRLARAEAELTAERAKVDLLQRHLDDVRRMLPPPDAKPRRRWWPW